MINSIKKKDGELNFFIVMLILAMIMLVLILFFQSNMFNKFLKPVEETGEEGKSKLECMVLPGDDRDKNGDGFIDGEDCDKYSKEFDD